MTNNDHKEAIEMLERACENIIDGIKRAHNWELSPEDMENFRDTPDRFARALLEKCRGVNSEEKCRKILSSTFPSTYAGLVVFDPIRAISLCPHHLENVIYTIHIGYIPTSRCVGLSKVIRATKLFAAQPILQETFTERLCNLISECISPEGVGVITKASHNCITCRGIMESNSSIKMASITGTFLSDPSVKDEFYKLINHK